MNKTYYEEPTTKPSVCTEDNPCEIFNCPFKGFPHKKHRTCVGFADVTSTLPEDEIKDTFGVTDEKYEEIFLNFNFAIGSCKY